MTAGSPNNIRARLSLVGIGLWRCERCGMHHDAETSWVEVRADGTSPEVPAALVLCPSCADSGDGAARGDGSGSS